ncbi:YqaE/Pmp3 family membrane protein [Vreelandella sp. GE22]
MDAREYLNRKGVGVEREPDRPNTLEEKAWARARDSGDARPKSGTPHDWEDWERYHDELADDAGTLEQKIDKEAHRKALERERREAQEQNDPVEQFSPDAASQPAPVEHFTPDTPQSAAKPAPEQPPKPNNLAVTPQAGEPAALKAAYAALAVLLPPLGVGLTGAGGKRVFIALVLTLLGWVPGALYALVWVLRR